MKSEVFRFQLGGFDCAIVNDGTYAYPDPGHLFFENVPRQDLAKALKEHNIDLDSWQEYVSSYPSLVVDTGRHLVLVDTGMGPRVSTTGRLLDNLQAAGFHPEDFAVVVLTHVHPDHVGGNVDGSGKPAYPNARYVLWQREWDFWTGEPDLSALRVDGVAAMMLDTAERYLPPIKEQVDLLEPGSDIVPGITAIAAPGHTPGQLALVVSSQNEHLLVLADAVFHPVHIKQPDWVSLFDLLVDETVTTRRRLLGRAAAEEMLVFAPHFVFPGLGRVRIVNGGWCWIPQESEFEGRSTR